MKHTSRKFTLNWTDFIKGFLVAAVSGGLTTLYEYLSSGEAFSPVVIQKAALAAVSGGIAYLLKNLLTDSNGNMVTKKEKITDEPLGI